MSAFSMQVACGCGSHGPNAGMEKILQQVLLKDVDIFGNAQIVAIKFA